MKALEDLFRDRYDWMLGSPKVQDEIRAILRAALEQYGERVRADDKDGLKRIGFENVDEFFDKRPLPPIEEGEAT
jgi:hypothetical protein